jgi:poly-gamma-glutamate synthesis protein (capsule biosynthesis protein)
VADSVATVFLCGDVMLGRGIDQVLPHPGDPTLWESWARDARRYVDLAEKASGPIPRPVDGSWIWGESLPDLEEVAPDVRIVNLETSITTSSEHAVGKTVLYRMSPDNIAVLAAGRPDVCVLANNHVLDFGRRGLAETLDSLARAGIPTAGAGADLAGARRPAVVPLAGGHRILVLAVGLATSGIPPGWAATEERAGVAFAPGPSRAAADAVLEGVRATRRDGDVVVVSVHWGGNWGYDVAEEEIAFAHHLVDGGVDLVHGHSSHHPRPVGLHRGRLILYGCGDFIDDYEGIGGHDRYRDDLRLGYLATVETATGRLVSLRILPWQAHRMSLRRVSARDASWLRSTLDDISRPFGVRFDLAGDGTLAATSV